MNRENSNSGEGSKGAADKLDSRLIPVMREAVALVQLALFGQLKEQLAASYADMPAEKFRRLVGCIVSDLFGTPGQDSVSQEFAREQRDVVEKELWAMAGTVPAMLPLVTDALRMQTLCDHEEGVNSMSTLLRARALGVLQEERTLPMPSTFMIAVRKLGAEKGLLQPMSVRDPAPE